MNNSTRPGSFAIHELVQIGLFRGLVARQIPPVCLGAELIDHIQKIAIAAIAMADMKVWAQRSDGVWIRRQYFSFPGMFSILWRFRYSAFSYGISIFLFSFMGMKATILRMTKIMPLTTLRSSTRGTPCDSGKNGEIRAIWSSDKKKQMGHGGTA